MKKNSRGFMLAEAIVSATVIITSMVLLYSTFNKLYTLYDTKNNYYNIDGIYATKEMINYLMDNDFEKYINQIFENKTYSIIIDNTNCYGGEVCNNIKDLYKVNKMIITEYDKSTLEEEVKNIPMNQSFKEYIDYVIDYYGVSNHDTKYTYLVLTEIKDGDNYYYSNLGIG